MGVRFHRRIPILPGLRLNLGKRSVSLSTGVRGFRVTSGTAGQRVTVGIPGTGLFYTHKIPKGAPAHQPRTKAEAINLFVELLEQCNATPNVTLDHYAALLNQQGRLGLSDSDLPPELLAFVTGTREGLRERGYRLVEYHPRPTSARRALLIVGGVILLAIIAALLLQRFPPTP